MDAIREGANVSFDDNKAGNADGTDASTWAMAESPPLPGFVGAVFVSHSSRDGEAAMSIVAALEAAGVPCWVAPRDIPAGADWNHSIMTGISSARALLLVYTRHSVGSDPVKREVERALNRRLPVIPVRLEQCPPSPALEYMISTAQWVDAFPPPLDRHREKIVTAVGKALNVAHATPRPDPVGPPKYVGHYQLLEQLGEGGMGTVFKARQTAPVKREVAVKLIKPGFDSAEVIARFESERQALARMDHANVARVLDAGTDERGRPYFVMEYVRGVPITRFADDNKLTVRERLGLFIQVCDAIAHAHTKALIHRDIKASNVLAYMDDGKPKVKVIDFGIAKALTADRLTDRTFNTERGQAIGTYESMSPEQADGSPDIDTKTDVYSLGVLLYEMLAGGKPFEKAELAKVADGEVRRIIREVEPPRPSTRLSSLKGEAGTRAAAARRGQLEALAKELRSELEWIPLKAMRKERARRYESPQQMAEDVARYLDGRPLIAGPERRAYRFRKFIRRNRVPLAVVSSFGLLIAASVSIYVYGTSAEQQKTNLALADAQAQRVESQRSERKAIGEAAKATAAERKTSDLLRASESRHNSHVAISKRLAQQSSILDRLQHRVPEVRFNNNRLEDAVEFMGDLSGVQIVVNWSALEALGVSRDSTITLNLFDTTTDTALKQIARQVASNASVVFFVQDDGSIVMTTDADSIMVKRVYEMQLIWLDGDTWRNLVDIIGKINGIDHSSTLQLDSTMLIRGTPAAHSLISRAISQAEAALSYDELTRKAKDLASKGSDAEAIIEMQRSLGRLRQLRSENDPIIVRALDEIGAMFVKGGRLSDAESARREALQIQRTITSDNPRNSIRQIEALAQTLRLQKKYPEATALLSEALALRRKFPENHEDIASSLDKLADILVDQHRDADAAALRHEASNVREKPGEPDKTVADSPAEIAGRLARELLLKERYADAEKAARKAIDLQRPKNGASSRVLYGDLLALYFALSEQGKTQESEAVARELFDITRMDRPGSHDHLESLDYLMSVLDQLGKDREASEIYEGELIALRQHASASDSRLAKVLQIGGIREFRIREYYCAGVRLQEAYDICKRNSSIDRSDVALITFGLGKLKMALGEFREAEPLFRTAMGAFAEQRGNTSNQVHVAMIALAEVLEKTNRVAGAEKLLRDWLDVRRKARPADAQALLDSLLDLAIFMVRTNRPKEAESLFREALTICRGASPPNRLDIANSASGLGRSLLAQGKYTEAEPLLREALDTRQKSLGATDPATLLTAGALADLLDRTRRTEESKRVRATYDLRSSTTRQSVPTESGPAARPK